MTKTRRREPRQADLGTPELLRKRLEALGAQRTGWPVPDPTFAESLLGCLLFQGWLHPEYEAAKRMYDAGISFTGWWTLVYPKCNTHGTLGQFVPMSDAAEIDTAEAERLLAAASVVLKRERQVYDAVVNTCVYQRCDERRVEKLRRGLGWLVEWQRGR